MEYDDVMKTHVGTFGLFQKLRIVVLSMPSIYFAYHALSPVFISGTPEHWCKPPLEPSENCSHDALMAFSIPTETRDNKLLYSRCQHYVRNYSLVTGDEICKHSNGINDSSLVTNMTSFCDAWEYDASSSNTVVREWNLVCHSAYMAGNAASVFMVGATLSNVASGPIADRFGRRMVLLISHACCVLSSIGCAFAPNFIAFLIFRLTIGIFVTTRSFTSFALGLEFCGIKKREMAGVIISGSWEIGYLLLPLTAYLIKDWRMMQLAISVPDILMSFAYFFLIPESPRWLLANDREQEARQVLIEMAKSNKKTIPEELKLKVTKEHKFKMTNATYVELVRTPGIRWLTLNFLYNWFACSLGYYGLSFNTYNLGGDPYINCLISGAVEIAAWPYILYTFPKFGRRWPFFVSMIITGISLLMTAAIPSDMNWLIITLAMIGKAMVCTAFMISYLYAYEVFPTSVKVTGLNVIALGARIAGVLAAYVGFLSEVSRVLPLVIFGVLSTSAGILVLSFPETKAASVKRTTEDGEQFIRENSCQWCSTKTTAQPEQISVIYRSQSF